MGIAGLSSGTNPRAAECAASWKQRLLASEQGLSEEKAEALHTPGLIAQSLQSGLKARGTERSHLEKLKQGTYFSLNLYP